MPRKIDELYPIETARCGCRFRLAVFGRKPEELQENSNNPGFLGWMQCDNPQLVAAVIVRGEVSEEEVRSDALKRFAANAAQRVGSSTQSGACERLNARTARFRDTTYEMHFPKQKI